MIRLKFEILSQLLSHWWYLSCSFFSVRKCETQKPRTHLSLWLFDLFLLRCRQLIFMHDNASSNVSKATTSFLTSLDNNRDSHNLVTLFHWLNPNWTAPVEFLKKWFIKEDNNLHEKMPTGIQFLILIVPKHLPKSKDWLHILITDCWGKISGNDSSVDIWFYFVVHIWWILPCISFILLLKIYFIEWKYSDKLIRVLLPLNCVFTNLQWREKQ